MKKTILIGSILTTIILILVSFTSVISAQTKKQERNNDVPGSFIEWLIDLIKDIILYWEPGLLLTVIILIIFTFILPDPQF